jgi:DNA polymerase-3 subunit beta
MQIIVLQENLQNALTYLQKAIPSKPQVPILSSILLSVSENVCTLGATDLYFGVKATIAAQIEKEGQVAVPGKEFREIIGSLPAGEIQMAFTGNTLTITTAHTHFSLQCQDCTDYPQFPQVSGEKAIFTRNMVEVVSQLVLFSTSADQARPLLTGVLFSLDAEKTRAVATDGFRLSVCDFAPPPEQQPIQFILPSRVVSEVCRISAQMQAETVVFTVSESLKQVFIAFDSIEIYARVLEGEYPPYEKIIPASFTTQLTVAGDEVLEQVKRSTIYSRDTSNIVQCEVSPENLTIKATSSALGTFSGEVPSVQVAGPGGVIAFKAKYILDFLQAAKQMEIQMSMNDSLKPALFQAKELPGFRYIVMPFRVSS